MGARIRSPVVDVSAKSGTALDNIFPALAVDPSNGTLYAAWSAAHTVSLSRSTDHGVT